MVSRTPARPSLSVVSVALVAKLGGEADRDNGIRLLRIREERGKSNRQAGGKPAVCVSSFDDERLKRSRENRVRLTACDNAKYRRAGIWGRRLDTARRRDQERGEHAGRESRRYAHRDPLAARQSVW